MFNIMFLCSIIDVLTLMLPTPTPLAPDPTQPHSTHPFTHQLFHSPPPSPAFRTKTKGQKTPPSLAELGADWRVMSHAEQAVFYKEEASQRVDAPLPVFADAPFGLGDRESPITLERAMPIAEGADPTFLHIGPVFSILHLFAFPQPQPPWSVRTFPLTIQIRQASSHLACPSATHHQRRKHHRLRRHHCHTKRLSL